MRKESDDSSPILSVTNLSFSYKEEKDKQAVRNISFSARKGELIGIIGASGAGKSTLISCLNRIIPQFIKGNLEGSIQVDNIDINGKSIGEMAEKVGVVFQDFEVQLFSTNVELELAFGPENLKISRDTIEKNVREVIEIINMQGFEEREPSTLSGGEKQRLVIGSVLTMQPQIICLDEATTDLDPVSAENIYRIVRMLTANERRTVLIVEHEIERLLELDKILVIHEGKVLREGTPGEILTDYALLEKLGLMPLHLSKYFNILGYAAKDCPIQVGDAVKLFRSSMYCMDPKRYQLLLKKDRDLKKQYKETIVSVRDLNYSYSGKTDALHNISFDIKRQEFIAIVGHNGSGKTTLAKNLNGLLMPKSGEVLIAGRNTKDTSIYELGRMIGYVFQNPDHQIFADTVYDEVAFSLRMRNYDDENIASRVKEVLEVVGLTGYEDSAPFSLTKGERQRVAVASTLASRPEILILDEPTTGLDYKEQKAMMNLIKKLNENGHTIIVITHSMWVVCEYAHRIIGIRNGCVETDGGVREVLRRDDVLKSINIKRPQTVEFSSQLGSTVLSYDELIYCTGKSKEAEV